MADISQITIPSGDTYNLKDPVARANLTSLTKTISITIPADTMTETITDSWITADTACIAHNIHCTGTNYDLYWSFADGSVTFTAAPPSELDRSFSFMMIKNV